MLILFPFHPVCSSSLWKVLIVFPFFLHSVEDWHFESESRLSASFSHSYQQPLLRGPASNLTSLSLFTFCSNACSLSFFQDSWFGSLFLLIKFTFSFTFFLKEISWKHCIDGSLHSHSFNFHCFREKVSFKKYRWIQALPQHVPRSSWPSSPSISASLSSFLFSSESPHGKGDIYKNIK